MLHISRSSSSAWTQLWCCHRSSLSLQKVIDEKLMVTFHDLKWPWRHEEGSLVAIFRFMVSIIPVTRCLSVSNGFRPKRRLSIFSQWMEMSQSWPDLGSPISQFRDKHFIATVTDINRWKFQGLQGDPSFGVAMTSVQTFSEVMSWPGDLTLSEMGLKLSHVRNKCMKRCAKNPRGYLNAPRQVAG